MNARRFGLLGLCLLGGILAACAPAAKMEAPVATEALPVEVHREVVVTQVVEVLAEQAVEAEAPPAVGAEALGTPVPYKGAEMFALAPEEGPNRLIIKNAEMPPAGTSPAEARGPVPVTSADGGFVVQLGAFASNANAGNFVAHVANQLAPIGVEAKVRQVGGLFRVFVGPYPTREDARRTADRLREALGLPSTIAPH